MIYHVEKIQFQKYDRFGNAVFLAKLKDNKETYEQLSELNDKVEAKYEEASSCLYSNEEHEYMSLRMTKQTKSSFKTKNTYSLSFNLKFKKNEDDRQYINALLVKSKCIERYIEDMGEDVDL